MNQAEGIKDIQKTLKAMQKSLQKSLDGVQKSFDLVGADIAELKQDKEKLTLQLSQAHKRIDALEKTVNQLQLTLKLPIEVAPGVPADRNDTGNRGQIPLEVSRLSDRVTNLELQIESMRKELNDVKQRSSSTSFYPAERSLDDIRLRLEMMERLVRALNSSGGRTSFFPPTASTTGKLVLVNRSLEEVLFLVNGSSYRIGPLATKIVENHPSGSITYEVVSSTRGSSVQRVTGLPANYTLTLSTD
jgi:chromosome segregation ATPase